MLLGGQCEEREVGEREGEEKKAHGTKIDSKEE